MKANQAHYRVDRMCSVFSVARSGYYAWRDKRPGKRRQANAVLDDKIGRIFARHQKRYGAIRVTDDLRDEGETCSKNRVARRMRVLGLKAKGKRKFRITTDSNHNLPVAQNLLNREFSATAINQKWAGDITYVWTTEGWLYLAVIIDLYSRAVIGWSIQATITRELVGDALMMALQRRGFPRGVLCHSDRGSQYCSKDYQKIIKTYGLICSMSRKGDCWDNAVSESFFHSLKTECLYHEKYETKAITKQGLFQYIEMYYNRIRRHSTIGSMAPMVFESQAGYLV